MLGHRLAADGRRFSLLGTNYFFVMWHKFYDELGRYGKLLPGFALTSWCNNKKSEGENCGY